MITIPIFCPRCGLTQTLFRSSSLAALIVRLFGETCPRCGGRMELIKARISNSPPSGVKNTP